MASDLGSFGVKVGGRVNNVRQALAEKRGRLKEISEYVNTSDVVIVHDYHPETATVDVLLKADPNVPIIYGVPIADTHHGGLRIIGGFRTIVAGDPDPTVGIIIYPRLESSLTNLDYDIRAAPTSKRLRDTFGFFLACIPIVPAEGSPITIDRDVSEDSDNLGPRDTALVHKSGSFILFKENGDVVIKATGDVFIGGVEQSVKDMDGAAVGEHGLGGSHSSSGRVKIGT